MVCGHFDPYPHIGHINHMMLAKKLGDKLVVVVSKDEHAIAKKGICFTPILDRMMQVSAIKYVDEVIPSVDEDGTVANTIRKIKPQVFAKGGDRSPNNLPQSEINACKDVNCEIVYGVGSQMKSSRKLIKDWFNAIIDALMAKGRPTDAMD